MSTNFELVLQEFLLPDLSKLVTEYLTSSAEDWRRKFRMVFLNLSIDLNWKKKLLFKMGQCRFIRRSTHFTKQCWKPSQNGIYCKHHKSCRLGIYRGI